MKYPLIILSLIMLSCESKTCQDSFSIAGYSIGDSIDDGITVTKLIQERWSYGIINDYPYADVLLLNNHIIEMGIDSLSLEDAYFIRQRVSNIYEKTARYTEDTVYDSFEQWDEENFYWFDTISEDFIVISRKLQDNPESISNLSFYNGLKRGRYERLIFGGPTEYDFTSRNDDE